MHRLVLVMIVACAPSCWADSPVRHILTRDLSPEQSGLLTAESSARTVAERMTPEQKQAALVGLRDLERGLPQQQPILKEMGDAYLALGSSADAARVAARLQELEPNKPDGYRIAAHALYDSGDYEDAAAEALAALMRDPRDQRAITVLKLSRDRISNRDTDDEIDGSAVVGSGDDASSALGQPTVEKNAKLNDLAEPPTVAANGGADEKRPFPWLPAGAATTLAAMGAWLWGRREDDAVPAPLIEERFTSGQEQAEHYERTAKLQEFGRKASWVTLYGSIGLTAALGTYGAWTYFAGSLPSMGALLSTEGTVLGGNGAAVLTGAIDSAAPVVAAGVGTAATKAAVDETADVFGGTQVSYAESEIHDRAIGPREASQDRTVLTGPLIAPMAKAQTQPDVETRKDIRQSEYERMGDFCNSPPPIDDDECSMLSQRIDQAKRCVELYEVWDARWQPGRHNSKIRTWRRRLNNLKTEHKAKCAQK